MIIIKIIVTIIINDDDDGDDNNVEAVSFIHLRVLKCHIAVRSAVVHTQFHRHVVIVHEGIGQVPGQGVLVAANIVHLEFRWHWRTARWGCEKTVIFISQIFSLSKICFIYESKIRVRRCFAP